MAKKNANNRSEFKEDLKEAVGSYNAATPKQSPKRISGDIKKELDASRIELSPKQNELYKMIRNKTFVTVQGPAGTSKTFSACYAALKLLADRKIEKIILTKPIKESGEELGHLPGPIAEKTEPFMKSYISNFDKIIGKQSVSFLRSIGVISVEPLAYLRGITFDDSIILLDEAQNATIKQLMLWITRLGKSSKAVLMGDISQYDIKKRDSKFVDFIKMVSDIDEVSNFKFDANDIVRNKILIEIVNRYEQNRSKFE